MENIEIVNLDVCCVCGKQVEENEGLRSSNGDIVCSHQCRENYMKSINPKLTVYSRVTGYCTPVSSWNKGKLKEFSERKRYNSLR